MGDFEREEGNACGRTGKGERWWIASEPGVRGPPDGRFTAGLAGLFRAVGMQGMQAGFPRDTWTAQLWQNGQQWRNG